MLGLSVGKILFTILIIVVVWKAFAMISRLQQAQKQRVRDRGRSRPATRHGRGQTVDLVACPRCGSYYDPAIGCECGHRRT